MWTKHFCPSRWLITKNYYSGAAENIIFNWLIYDRAGRPSEKELRETGAKNEIQIGDDGAVEKTGPEEFPTAEQWGGGYGGSGDPMSSLWYFLRVIFFSSFFFFTTAFIYTKFLHRRRKFHFFAILCRADHVLYHNNAHESNNRVYNDITSVVAGWFAPAFRSVRFSAYLLSVSFYEFFFFTRSDPNTPDETR